MTDVLIVVVLLVLIGVLLGYITKGKGFMDTLDK